LAGRTSNAPQASKALRHVGYSAGTPATR
jgi:hypothetical protein